MRTAIIILACITIMALGATQASGDENPTRETASAYGRIIDAFAADCLFKTDLRYSKSRHIRNDVAISCLKNGYWQHHREELIQAMTEAGVEAKGYQVRHFLNNRFFAHARARNLNLNAVDPLAALPENPPDEFEKMNSKR